MKHCSQVFVTAARNLAKRDPSISQAKLFSSSSNVSAMGSAESFIRDLKLKLVHSLTDSLPQSDREKLMQSIGPGYVERKSVGEAVAVALAKEKDFRGEYIEKIEKAAMERIETEKRLRDETEKELQEVRREVATTLNESGDIEEENDIEQTQQFHPILGELIADLNHKRIYLMSIENLAKVPIFEKQRAYRHARAKVIAQEKLKRKDIGLPGIITLFEDKEGSVSIIDGQHRVGMLAILSMKKAPGLQFSLDKILVEVFKNQSQLDDSIIAGDLFSDINKAEPVKLIDMPGEANRDHLRIINPVAETLEQMFPNMFKPNARCLPPHLHLDTFRELLYNSEIIKKYNIKDADKLLEWIFDRNKIMEERYIKASEKWDEGLEVEPIEGGVSPKKYSNRVIKKAITNKFFLGLDKTWLK